MRIIALMATVVVAVVALEAAHPPVVARATDIDDGRAPLCATERHLYGVITGVDGHTLVAQSEGSAGRVFLFTSRATIRPEHEVLRQGEFFRAYGCFGENPHAQYPVFRATYLTLFATKRDIVYIADSEGERAERERAEAASPAPQPVSEASSVGGKDAVACGGYRWPIKIGLDAGAKSLRLAPQVTTIAALDAIRLTGVPLDSRSAPESMVYELQNVKLVTMFVEHDRDRHLVVSDGGNSITLESPDPSCVQGSAFASQIATVRKTLDTMKPTSGSILSVTGVGFYDSPGSGGMELHPLLSVCAGKDCQPPDYFRASR